MGTPIRPQQTSFNPYFNGMKIELCPIPAEAALIWRFNPYFNGMKIEPDVEVGKQPLQGVLILILME